MSNPQSISRRVKKDCIVSIRMPKGLVEELRDIQKINHFMDISDEIRYIIRKYCIMQTLQKPGDDAMKKKEQLIKDLNQILQELKTDSSQ